MDAGQMPVDGPFVNDVPRPPPDHPRAAAGSRPSVRLEFWNLRLDTIAAFA
jgi:hypothetical protein